MKLEQLGEQGFIITEPSLHDQRLIEVRAEPTLSLVFADHKHRLLEVLFLKDSGSMLWSSGILLNAILSTVFVFEGPIDRQAAFEARLDLVHRLKLSRDVFFGGPSDWTLMFDTSYAEPFFVFGKGRLEDVISFRIEFGMLPRAGMGK